MMRIKEGAEINGLRAETLLAYIIADQVYTKYGIECVLTEGTGGKHGRASLHYVGLAIDIRTRNIESKDTQLLIAAEIRERLGDQYDVILEDTHCHLEHQPK